MGQLGGANQRFKRTSLITTFDDVDANACLSSAFSLFDFVLMKALAAVICVGSCLICFNCSFSECSSVNVNVLVDWMSVVV